MFYTLLFPLYFSLVRIILRTERERHPLQVSEALEIVLLLHTCVNGCCFLMGIPYIEKIRWLRSKCCTASSLHKYFSTSIALDLFHFFTSIYVCQAWIQVRVAIWTCTLVHTFQYLHLIVMSLSLLWRHIVLLTVGVYSSNHGVLYTIEISMTRRFQKSVGPSVYLSMCNPNKKTCSSFIINSRIIMRISGERALHPL